MTQLWVTADELDNPTLTDSVEAARAASSILYMLSGRKYPGVSRVTEVYESLHGSLCGMSAANYYVVRSHQARQRPQLKLRGTPVRNVVELRVGHDRHLVSPNEYRILDQKYLEPTNNASWSMSSLVEITYEYGMTPPLAARRAARALANELVKSRTDSDNCRLPDRVTSISRQGVSMTILDPQDFLDQGRTGLYEVDLFLKATNPFKAAAKTRIFSAKDRVGYTIKRSPTRRTAGDYDLVFERGISLNRTFKWSSGGVPQPITGEWTPQAFVRNYDGNITLDLTPYLIVEPTEDQVAVRGRIDLDVPATLTEKLGEVQGTWALVLRRASDPGDVVKLLEGDVWAEA